MHILFANTGVQIVCIPLQSGRRYTTAQIGYGWQTCRCQPEAEADEDGRRDDDEEGLEPVVFPYIQWQIIQSNVSKLFLAVDTSLGDPEIGYFADPTTLAGDFHVTLKNVLDRTGQPLLGLPPIELCLRAASATAGEAKPVHMVVDFGNSRTGALLIEMAGEVSQSAEMMPFELSNRYSLDYFNDEGEQISRPATRWFSSKTRWANVPYLEPPAMAKKEFYRETKKGHLRQEAGGPRARDLRQTESVRRLVDGPHGPRGGRDLPDHAGQGRFPHGRQFARSATCGRTTTAGWKARSGTWPIRTTGTAPTSSPPSCTGRC